MRNSALDEQVDEGEIAFARWSVRLARCQAMLQSWLPAKATNELPAVEDTVDIDEDSELEAQSESGGVGDSHEDGSASSKIVMQSRASSDKLLEQLLGKKAAQAKRKEQQEAGKAMSSRGHISVRPTATTKQVGAAPNVESEDEEEEVGRTAAFSSRRKTIDAKLPLYTVTDTVLDENAEPPDPREDLATVREMVKEQETDSEGAAKPKKRKADSYLDELLARKAKKSKKRSQKKDKGVDPQ